MPSTVTRTPLPSVRGNGADAADSQNDPSAAPNSATTVPGADAPPAKLAEFTMPSAVTCGAIRCSESSVKPKTTTAISSVVEVPQLTAFGGELGLRGLLSELS